MMNKITGFVGLYSLPKNYTKSFHIGIHTLLSFRDPGGHNRPRAQCGGFRIRVESVQYQPLAKTQSKLGYILCANSNSDLA